MREDPPQRNWCRKMHNIRRYERQLSSSIRFEVSEYCDDDYLTRVATWDEMFKVAVGERRSIENPPELHEGILDVEEPGQMESNLIRQNPWHQMRIPVMAVSSQLAGMSR